MKDLKIYIGIASVILLIYLVAEYNRPVPVSWAETLDRNDKIPFGTYILYNRLEDIFPGSERHTFREPIYNVVNDHELTHGSCIIICDAISLSEVDYNKLSSFVRKGNDVFIASSYFGKGLNDSLKVELQSELKNDTVKSYFTNNSLGSRQYGIDKRIGNLYFRSYSNEAIVLGKNSAGHVNYIAYKLGKGHLFLNANPLLFTNYSLLNEQGATYASIALSHVKNDGNLIWDDYYVKGREDESSPLRVLLRNNALRAALYISLFSLVLFVLYEMKRRQRVIPVIEPLKNTTLEFVTTVGQVYYEQRNNNNIAQKMATYWLEQIRSKYRVPTSKLDDEFVDILMKRSGVSEDLIKTIIEQIKVLNENSPMRDKELADLNNNIEQFYLQSK
ncbi:MAG: DUF4350 domain-containing protein [Flavipsychrobacter sp.]